ncbi:hypothetical protein HPHPH11_0605 [Helicobacter pylori Hp H-11]|nr:hypothetical protein HPHPH43_0425 [Helicobacter pylori Hp H-43]EJB87063.1 hypothetical protein HPHPH11_0605 [Helicobacter pylori Hp H-11]
MFNATSLLTQSSLIRLNWIEIFRFLFALFFILLCKTSFAL